MKNFKINLTSLIIAALIFGLGGLSLLTYIKTRDVLNTNLETQISSLTLSSTAEVGLWLLAHQKEMEVMANTPIIKSGDKDAISSYLNQEIQRNPNYEQFFVADNLGEFYANSGRSGSAADRDYFQNVMTTGLSEISDPYISRGSGNQIIVVAVPIRKDDKVIGLMGGKIRLEELAKKVTSEKVGEIGSAFIVQKDGLVILHSNQDFSISNNPLKDDSASQDLKDAVRKMIQGETGFTRYTLQKEVKYLAYAPVPGVKWSLGVTIPVTYVTRQLRYLPIYFIVITVLFGIILAYFLSRWLVVPLRKVTKFTTELNDKLYEKVDIYRLDSRVIEVQSLATNFQTMAGALHKSFQELESANANLEAEIFERTRVQEDLEHSYEELTASDDELRFNYEKLQVQEESLRESERRFRSMLENIKLITGIIDKDGQIIFCNDFALELTGFQKFEVIGQNYFDMFIPYERQEDAKACFEEVLNTKKLLKQNVFSLRIKNGEERFVNWNYTLLFDSEGNVSGIASIGEDITERKQFQERLEHMSFHDALTGLYNRTYFEEELRLLEEECSDPVGMIVSDVDGLKLVNDTLGHSIGDQLLRLTADIIKKCFREEDKLFRIGGDEFAIILPKSELSVVEQACSRVRMAVERYNDENVEFPLSLSMGYAVSGKPKANLNLGDVFKEADDNMYREKLHRSKSTRSAIVQALMKALEVRDFITEGHADRLQDLVVLLGRELDLSERNLADLRLLAQFHDIGKVGIPDRILFKPGRLTSEEFKEMQRHSEIGHRIAQSAPDLLPIADQILRHHEWWNGGGYPLGLKGYDIPLECRILAIADAYDAMTSDRPYRKAMSQEEALMELRKNIGIQFDSKLVQTFIRVITR
ncbi:Sensory box protein [Candidatus Desulfosporosinus infrequens]|uniref:Sensory box protein n=1 Tax=Candidatus Desulfosporosinus infrequens TaxID=2043169 RepID=A0A2U3K165_9FIRM|nr:Sensory box protein [Candidatus Desulfosporosinus infrequens]